MNYQNTTKTLGSEDNARFQPVEEKPRIWRCRSTGSWKCISDEGVQGSGTTKRGAYNEMLKGLQ